MSKNKQKIDFKNTDKNKRQLFILFGIAIILAFIMFIYRAGTVGDILGLVKLLSDIFFMPAILYLSIAGILAASNAGTFRIFSYGTNLIRSKLNKESDFRKKYKDYFEYYTEKQKTKIPCNKFFVVGIACLILSVIFNILYYFV